MHSVSLITYNLLLSSSLAKRQILVSEKIFKRSKNFVRNFIFLKKSVILCFVEIAKNIIGHVHIQKLLFWTSKNHRPFNTVFCLSKKSFDSEFIYAVQIVVLI